jgi:hypothetical protein
VCPCRGKTPIACPEIKDASSTFFFWDSSSFHHPVKYPIILIDKGSLGVYIFKIPIFSSKARNACLMPAG